ncbi:hypothetical protein FC70_GL001215 [Paucilactobacillus oligofermentans DSM 15707 = LMG 22743]|uniref:DUF4767 domain-containing protein n=1 Tax=Paucilactobacillus oligofermentans DSM 15707 = LMG 22743 TaxID=1423778 RepID=A0A0R1REZ8_9LACO|nr:DUF4767 domain-containing protein [Paucilactobacillus oligofermentans]KRL55613.1 hypothetical protein FC70_GL001215 [Paucilactobacillus oligofermentans DSM 15707 = LMG 22743]CUS25398.1 Uncharacterized protein LACOL_0090 [Paucilactobacillus oligofermentans DSM 15707 = LMG 22743]
MKHGSKRKNIWVIMGLVLVIVVCLGFGGYKLFYGNHTSSDKNETAVHQQKNSWNKTKDKKLNQFMNQWDSDYEQATNSKKIKFYHNTIPTNLKNTKLTVNDKKVTVAWSIKGTGTKDYQIVSAYTDAPTNDDDPTLYLFTMHNGTPVVLETDDDSETLDFSKSKNDDLVDNFKNVVDGKQIETVKSSSSSSEQSSENSSSTSSEISSSSNPYESKISDDEWYMLAYLDLHNINFDTLSDYTPALYIKSDERGRIFSLSTAFSVAIEKSIDSNSVTIVSVINKVTKPLEYEPRVYGKDALIAKFIQSDSDFTTLKSTTDDAISLGYSQ